MGFVERQARKVGTVRTDLVLRALHGPPERTAVLAADWLRASVVAGNKWHTHWRSGDGAHPHRSRHGKIQGQAERQDYSAGGRPAVSTHHRQPRAQAHE